MSTNKDSSSWADLGVALYERLHERSAVITYEFDNLEVSVPAGPEQPQSSANWKVNGGLQIRTTPPDGDAS